MSLLNTDKISTWMGSPPHHWKASEIEQIKQIHRCYRNAYSLKEELADEVEIIDERQQQNVERVDNLQVKVKKRQNRKRGESFDSDAASEEEDDVNLKKDEERFLPNDSCLRSKSGEKKAPLNPPFKDYTAFTNSCGFEYWRNHFEGAHHDKFLADTAQSLVSNICITQSRNEMRVHNGHLPFRKRREHITPLALVLHELKLWATHTLRTADSLSEKTFQEIKCRRKFLNGLSHKEVWGDTAIVFGQGMRAVAHDKLFRLFLSASEALERAEEYAYRGFSRRSSREKLYRVKNLLKDLIINEMRILSGRMTLQKKLSSPKTSRLQPTDLLNSIENQAFVDYKNFVNVMFFKMCQNPMVRATMTGEYDKPEVKEIIDDIGSWAEMNLFCIPDTSSDNPMNEPKFLMEKKRDTNIMPRIYAPTAADLKRLIRGFDTKAPVPDSSKAVIARLRNAFETNDSVARIIKLVMKNAAALQDLVPTIYAMHQLWSLAGDGGDLTVYDTMREHVIKIMQNTITRVHAMRTAGKNLGKEITRLSELKEEAMKKDALRSRRTKYKPAWIMNHKFIGVELLPNYDSVYDLTLTKLFELVKDARNYSLTSDQLDDKVVELKKMLDSLTGVSNGEDNVRDQEQYEIEATIGATERPGRKKEQKKKNRSKGPKSDNGSEWLRADNEFGAFSEFGKNNNFGDSFGDNFSSEMGSYRGGAGYGKYESDSEI